MEHATFSSSDPLARFLLHRCRLTPLSFALLAMGLTFLIFGSVAWATDTLVSKPGQVGFLDDLSIWVWGLLIKPVLFGYYLWEATAITTLLKQLERSQVVHVSSDDLHRVWHVRHHPWRVWLSFAVSLIGGVVFFVSRADIRSWASSGVWPRVVDTVVGLFGTYMTSMLVLGLVLNVWLLHTLLKDKELQINPLHPDRCGGLRSLSQYSLKTAYLAAIFGIMIGFTEYRFITQGVDQKYWILHLGIPLYLVVSLACFFGPLLTAHTEMQEAKERLLAAIAQQFQNDYLHTQTNLTADAETLQREVAKIQELRSFYTLTDEFPVWPFDVQTLRRYGLSVATPLLPPLLAILQKVGKGILSQWGISF